MKILNKLNKLVQESNSLQLHEKHKMLGNYLMSEGSNFTTSQTTKVVLKVLNECTDKDVALTNFIAREEKLLGWDSLNLSENILEIYNTSIYETETRISYIVDAINEQLKAGISECLLIENLRESLAPFSWSNECINIINNIDKKIVENYNGILLYKTYMSLYNNNQEIYEGLMTELEDAYSNNWDLRTLKSNTSAWSYLGEMVNLYQGFKEPNTEIQSSMTTSVDNIFGLVDVNESSREFVYLLNNDKHSINNFVVIENNEIRLLESSEFDLLSDGFKKMTQLVETSNMNLELLGDNKLKYYGSSDVVEFELLEGNVQIKLNGDILSSDEPITEMSMKMGVFNSKQLIMDTALIAEQFKNIYEFDNSHKLTSKLNENVTLSYLNFGDNTFTTLFDKVSGHRTIEKQSSLTNMVEYVKESFNYDLTDSFYTHLNEEKYTMKVAREVKSLILENIKELESVKSKILESIESDEFDNDILKQALLLTEEKIATEKGDYNKYETLN